MCVCPWEPLDRLCLWSLEGCGWSERLLLTGGGACFGRLRPGSYGLALCRRGVRRALLVRLPPGGNVEVWLDGDRGCYAWRRDGWHYGYNLS